jgi:hypothetical protein
MVGGVSASLRINFFKRASWQFNKVIFSHLASLPSEAPSIGGLNKTMEQWEGWRQDRLFLKAQLFELRGNHRPAVRIFVFVQAVIILMIILSLVKLAGFRDFSHDRF